MTVRIERIQFRNFRVLRDAELSLGPLTVIVGPNGSGKSTVWKALDAAQSSMPDAVTSSDLSHGESSGLQVKIVFRHGDATAERTLRLGGGWDQTERRHGSAVDEFIAAVRYFNLDPTAIAKPCLLSPETDLAQDGSNVAGVLDRLHNEHPERFDALKAELPQWFPEFDRVLFHTPWDGHRGFALRSKRTGAALDAESLSSGTRSALCMLTLAHLPEPPSLAFIEEPDAGVHPRLLQHVKDALVRLAFPRENDIDREPCQVIATTHSPYLLDLFRDHLDQVVIASRDESGATFQRLSDYPHVEEILGSGSLGSAWFTGILGGIPLGT